MLQQTPLAVEKAHTKGEKQMNLQQKSVPIVDRSEYIGGQRWLSNSRMSTRNGYVEYAI